MNISAEALKLHNESLVIDIHCHPSLKAYLFKRKFSQEFPPEHPERNKGFDPFTTQVTLPKMEKGGVDVIFSSIYLPEKGFKEHCTLVPFVIPLFDIFFHDLIYGLEKDDTSERPYIQTLQILDQFESQIKELIAQGVKIAIPKNFTELTAAIDEGKKVILHCLEGAHSLGRHYDNLDDYLKRVDIFFSKGVCLMTLGHFFRNNVVESTQGLPPKIIGLLGFNYDFDKNTGLTNVGKQVVRKMLDIGMIVDMVHSNKKARKEIFEINDERGSSKRPLVFSHTGIQYFYNMPLNISDKEILKIKECNGTIGMIFNNYWLAGFEDSSAINEVGIKYIIRTIKHINLITNSFDNISIGTDLDGFTDPCDDLADYLSFPLLTEALMKEGISNENVKKILGENALRVLKDGWGNS